MKIVHLMKNEKFLKGIVCFYNHFFNNGEHEILYYREKDDPQLANLACGIPQIEFDSSKSGDLIIYLKNLKCDYIVIHSLFLTTAEKVKLLLNRELYDKIVWIEWGADLYSWREPFGMKSSIKNRVNSYFRNNIKRVICIFPPDIDYFCATFPKSKADIFYAPYKSYPVVEEFEHYRKESKLVSSIKQNEPIYIQIGHNSMETLNHIDVLYTLEKFQNENIVLFLPLSYGGTEEYADKVEKCANERFPGKVKVLRNFVPREEYFKLTESVSIAIFDTERQCGLANINRLNFRNVKVFLSGQGQMYKYYSELGVPVCKYEDIKKMSYKDFIEPPHVTDKEKFQDYINELSNIEISVNRWRKIYEKMREDLNAK